MKRLTLLIYVVLALSSCVTGKAVSSSGNNDSPGPASIKDDLFFGSPAASINDILTPNSIEIIKNANFVQISRIKQQKNTGLYFDPSFYEKTDVGRQLSDKEIAFIKDVLLDPSSYRFDIKNKCPFLPEFEINFIHETKAIGVFVSMNCKSLAANDKGSSIVDLSGKADGFFELFR